MPSGSGSLEVSDWEALEQNQPKLVDLAIAGAERELREESNLPNDLEIETTIAGYYRSIERGGKPEFIALSKVAASSQEVKKNEAKR